MPYWTTGSLWKQSFINIDGDFPSEAGRTLWIVQGLKREPEEWSQGWGAGPWPGPWSREWHKAGDKDQGCCPWASSLLRSAWPQLEPSAAGAAQGAPGNPAMGVLSIGVPWRLVAAGRGPSISDWEGPERRTRHTGVIATGRKQQLLVLSWAIPRRRDGGKLLGCPLMTEKSRRVFLEKLQGK